MPWLALNGINVGSIVSVGSAPKGERRDIGDMSPAGDGSMRVTRQTRKRDLKFTTVPLTSADAFAWEAFIIGEGEVWSFNSSLYGSKGLGPNAGFNASVIIGLDSGFTSRFGAGRLRLPATTGSITFDNAAFNTFAAFLAYTVMIWRYEGGAWHHYIVRSDGAKWLDGVRNDAAVTTWLTVSFGDVTLTNVSGAAVDYDDLVVLPFSIFDAWAPIFGTALAAFPPLPYLDATGDLVPEASSRRVLGSCLSDEILVAVLGGARRKDARRLEVELKAA